MKLIKRFSGQHIKGSVYAGDALDLIKKVESNSVAVVFLDPPFNLGKKYGGTERFDRKPKQKYELWMRVVLDECVRVLESGGSLFLYHLPAWAMKFGAHLQSRLNFRHWIAVSMKNGFARGSRLYPAHYALLYFTKDEPRYFRRPKIKPLRCRHCYGLFKDYGGYLPIIQKKGLNLSDFWEDISPVRHSNRKYRTENELPLKLTERITAIAGRKGKVYLDPFAGTGAGVLAAAKRGMRFIAGDILKDSARLTAARIEELKTQLSSARSTKDG